MAGMARGIMYNVKLPYVKKGEYGFMGKILVKRFKYALSIYKKESVGL